MFAILSSQLAFSAASTLAKKSFEFGITSSLRGLSDVIKDRFQHSKALQDTQGELELKVKMLCLPVDILAHHVTQGNTALQEPLGVALGVLDEVEAFRQALVAQDVARAQDASSPDGTATNAAQLCKRLKELIARLDSVLPYLNLAISTVALLNQGPAAPLSASRLMAASWHLRFNPHPGAAVFSLPEASWHEERQLTAAGPAMSEAFRLCSLTVCRTQLPDSSGPAAGGGGSDGEHAAEEPGPYFGGYQLLLQQDLNDGLYHEPEESAATLRLQVCDIVGLEWETTQSLNQGENEYRPALVLHVLHSGGAAAAPAATADTAARPADRDMAAKQQLSAPQRTPDSAASRPSSRARSRLGAEAAGSGNGSQEPSPSKAVAGLVTPTQLLRPSPSAAASGRLAAGVGGSIRRYAVMLNMRRGEDSDGEEDGSESEQECGRQGHAAGSSSDEESDQRRQQPLAASCIYTLPTSLDLLDLCKPSVDSAAPLHLHLAG
ncbi:hypothetical protein COHA_005312 [Chlorella ohadii]|uniref:Uncharacterized protein n=1 Tax=Chlorella ohadii TaxID=2649997 RepID=A0AAD5H5L1_9CHLO|nr:hypothetical protein COHA_005312 [Chlorella ohadii]